MGRFLPDSGTPAIGPSASTAYPQMAWRGWTSPTPQQSPLLPRTSTRWPCWSTPPACSDCVRKYDPSEFARVVDVNLTGTMRMSVACRAALANAKGSIVNIASMHAIFGAPLSPAYAASKAGVVQLTKSLAVAWAEDGIRVNAIAPGWIETPMTVPARSDAARNRAILDRTPLGRWGTPDDIVGPALFLASDAASFITGAVLVVDGGYSAK